MNSKNSEYTILSKNSEFDLKIIEKYNAGLCLLGNEIKSLRFSNISIKDAFVSINHKTLEAYIYNMFIKKYVNINSSLTNTQERRVKKLLLKKSEIKKLSKLSKEKGYIIVPLKVFISYNKWAKVEIGLSQKKKKYKIKNEIKEKEMKRKMERKNYF
jgi:SsrA-binding protein